MPSVFIFFSKNGSSFVKLKRISVFIDGLPAITVSREAVLFPFILLQKKSQEALGKWASTKEKASHLHLPSLSAFCLLR